MGHTCSSNIHTALTWWVSDRTMSPPPSTCDWFRGVPWSAVPPEMEGNLVPIEPSRARPKLLGGSSKLAKLAEERRKKAATAHNGPAVPDGALNSLDRLSKPKDVKENTPPQPKPELKKYPIRKKREPTPPPREPTPPPEEPKEELPNLRASPTAFACTLSTKPADSIMPSGMTLQDLLSSSNGQDPFKGPSPDDTVLRAQQHSKNVKK